MHIQVIPLSIDGKYESLKRENADLIRANNQLRATVNQLTARLNQINQLGVTKDQFDTIEQLQAEVNRLKAALSAAGTDKSMVESRYQTALNKLRKDYTAACNQRDSYKATLDAQKKQAAQAVFNIDGKEYSYKAVEDLLARNKALVAENDTLKKFAHERAVKADNLHNQLAAEKTKLIEKDKTINTLKGQITSVTKGFEASQGALVEKIKEARNNERVISNLKEMLERQNLKPHANVSNIDLSEADPTTIIRLTAPYAVSVGLLNKAAAHGVFTIVNPNGEISINGHTYTPAELTKFVKEATPPKMVVTPHGIYAVTEESIYHLSAQLQRYINAIQDLAKQLD